MTTHGGTNNLSKNIGKEALLPITLLVPDAGAKGGGDEYSAMEAGREIGRLIGA